MTCTFLISQIRQGRLAMRLLIQRSATKVSAEPLSTSTHTALSCCLSSTLVAMLGYRSDRAPAARCRVGLHAPSRGHARALGERSHPVLHWRRDGRPPHGEGQAPLLFLRRKLNSLVYGNNSLLLACPFDTVRRRVAGCRPGQVLGSTRPTISCTAGSQHLPRSAGYGDKTTSSDSFVAVCLRKAQSKRKSTIAARRKDCE